jgi:hypothetical protein
MRGRARIAVVFLQATSVRASDEEFRNKLGSKRVSGEPRQRADTGSKLPMMNQQVVNTRQQRDGLCELAKKSHRRGEHPNLGSGRGMMTILKD